MRKFEKEKNINALKEYIFKLEESLESAEYSFTLLKDFVEEHKRIKNSISYRVGFFITAPIRFILRKIRNEKHINLLEKPIPELNTQLSALRTANKKRPHSLLIQAKDLSNRILLDQNVFDVKFYQEKNADVKSYCNGDDEKARRHWLNYGINEQRSSHPSFNLKYYLEKYKDVEIYSNNNNQLAIKHYVLYGKKEKRIASRPMVNSNARVIQNMGFKQSLGTLAFKPYKKNVALIAHNVGDFLYGGERSFIDIVQLIDKTKYNLYIIVPRLSKVFYDNTIKHCCEIIQFKYKWWDIEELRNEENIIKFRTLYRNYNIDLVHSNTIMVLDAIHAAKEENIPSLTHVRELISKDADLRRVLKSDTKNITATIIKNSDYLLCNSQITMNEFEKKNKNFKLYNTISDDLFDIKNEIGDKIYVAIISSNLEKKGILDFIKIADEVGKVRKDIIFRLIGEKSKLLKSLIEQKVVPQDNIEICGYIDSNIKAIEKGNIIINLSHFAESFGRTIAEGMAAGRMVIGYSWGALPELIDDGKNGFLVEYKNWMRCADLLKDVDKNIVLKFGEQGRVKAWDKFSNKNFAETLYDIYSDSLDQSSHTEDINFDNVTFNHNLQKLKLAYFCWHFPVPSETFVLNELRFLVEQGYDVQVFCKESPYKEFSPDFDIKYTKVKNPDELKLKFKENNINIVHAHFTYPTVTKFVWPACEDLKIPFSFIAHAQDIFKYENMDVNKVKEISESPYCLKIFTLGQYHKNFLIRRGVNPSKIFINPQVIYNNDFVFKEKTSFNKNIIALGRFVEKKGFDTLIRAAKLLESQGIHINLYGYGELEDDYRSLIKELDVKNFHLKGKLNGSSEIVKAFHDSDLLIQPSQVTLQGDMDGIPTVLVEAMSAGLPVMSTLIASIPDLLQDEINSFILGSNHPKAIAQKIMDFYDSSFSKINGIILNANKQIGRIYDINKSIKNLIDIWHGNQIDIVLVTYINEKYPNLDELKTVIERIFKYTQLGFNLTIVDNKSDDDTIEYLNHIQDQFENVQVHFNSENIFVGPATNVGLNNTNSDYIFYVCAVEGFALKRGWECDAIQVFNNNEKVGLAGTKGYSPFYMTGDKLSEGIREWENFRNKEFSELHPDRIFYHIQGGLFGIKRQMFNEIGGFNDNTPHSYTDVEYSYYSETNGWELSNIDSFLALFEKSRPGILSRLNEHTKFIHPGLLKDIDLYNKVAQRSTKLCNICEWHGEEFDTNQYCPKCNSSKLSRTIYNYFSSSIYSFRRLKALYINPHEELINYYWLKSFQGRNLSLEEFRSEISEKGQLSNANQSFDIILINLIETKPLTDQELKELYRVKNMNGSLFISGNWDQTRIKNTSEKDFSPFMKNYINIIDPYFKLEEEIRYDSEVVNYSFTPILKFKKKEEIQS